MIEELLKNPQNITVTTMALVAIAALVRGWVVPKYAHLERIADFEKQLATLEKDRNEYKTLAFQGFDLTKRLTSIAQRASGTLE